MAILVYRTPDGQVTELPLKPGINRLGRSEMNDIWVPDGSVSSNHCELNLDGEQVFVRDLGSTNGTAIDQAKVQQGVLLPGHILRVGNVEMVLQGDGQPVDSPIPTVRLDTPAPPVPVDIPAALPEGTAPCKFHGNIAAKWQCSKCGEAFCDRCVVDGRKFGVAGVKFCPTCSSKVDSLSAKMAQQKKESKTFATEMAAALKYPFRAEGSIILIGGTIFFTLAGFSMRFLFLLAVMVMVGTVGYLMAYSQRIIQASAQGEDDPPGWPDLSDYYQDLAIPFLQAVGLFVIYMLPYWLAHIYLPKNEPGSKIVIEVLQILATFMMPMAWLAISTHESIMGLSPHFVVPSIVRIFKHYVLLYLLLEVVVRAYAYIGDLLEDFKAPILGQLLASFVLLYFLTVISRMLGVVYYINRKKLQWF